MTSTNSTARLSGFDKMGNEKAMMRRLAAALGFPLLVVLACSVRVHAVPAAQSLFLLAGTPTNDAPQTYPVTLYTVGPDHALKLVRVIVPAEKGLYGVAYDLEGRVYVAYPNGVPTTVSVIHLRRPSLVDEVGFNPKSLLPHGNFFAASAGRNQVSHALYLAWAAHQPSNRRNNSGGTATVTVLISVSGTPTAAGSRIEENDWDQLASLRYGGCPGGPTFCVGPTIRAAKGQILMREGASLVPIGTVPPSVPAVKGGRLYGRGSFSIVAASPRFLIISPVRPVPFTTRTAQMFVLDKATRTWNTVTVPCNVPRSRLLGAWLATIIEDYNPANRLVGKNGSIPAGDNNPGRENERNENPALLPNVRMWYAASVGNFNLIPGTLVLDNLVNGRRITIHTGQEDSEILAVRKDGLVLYRVNDEIFSAKIEGDKLGPSKLVVKGEDVPEVHWAFWSKAQAEPASEK